MKAQQLTTYNAFKYLDLQIVVDLRCFTVSERLEPVEIILPDTGSQSGSSEYQKPVLVAPILHTRTQLKTPSSVNAGAIKHAPVKSKRNQVKPRHDGIFRRFTALVVDFFKEKFIWAKKKPVVIRNETEHDKRIAENYVFDEVQGVYIQRTDYERRARFNSDCYKPTMDEISRFPNRPKTDQSETDNRIDFSPKYIQLKSSKINIGKPTFRP
ncbi:hypothetical protein [Klebsiella variicola]|uniref:hypothetical protein n=1 Tax=Klebsiella variicola TaxID=244366 RepID=UPI00387A14D9